MYAFRDYVGDIRAKLEENELKFDTISSTNNFNVSRLYQQFLKNNKLESVVDGISFFHRKRLIIMVDRRDRVNEEDEVFMYEPPESVQNIPLDAVPEWYINSSRVTILPDMRFGDGKEAQSLFQHEDGGPLKEKLSAEDAAKFQNIGAGFHCEGSMLMFSFHAKQENVIKLYLYCRGQCIRFMPEDIRTLLPVLFNMEYGNNAEWIAKDESVNQYIDILHKGLIDVEFDAFQQSYM